jgi:hypothetical protein
MRELDAFLANYLTQGAFHAANFAAAFVVGPLVWHWKCLVRSDLSTMDSLKSAIAQYCRINQSKVAGSAAGATRR